MKMISRKVPVWFEKSIIYQINLRCFTQEGTLRSAERLLPHIKSMGVDIVYLCPFVMSDDDPDQNGWSRRQIKSGSLNPKNPYRISDYFTVDPEYGTDDDVESFVKTAHEIGLRVMFDLVYMHCGPNAVFLKEHPDFVKHNEDGSIKLTEYHFPIINFDSAELRKYLYDNMLYFVRRFDVDGYRCDVGDACPLDFWIEGSRRVRELKPDFVMLNEGRNAEALATCFDANYGFEWGLTLSKIFQDKMKPAELRIHWEQDAENNPKGARMIRWYENHDVANDSYDHRIDVPENGVKGEAALVLCYMIDGIPFLYNGNEIADCGRNDFFANRFSKGFHGLDWATVLTERGKHRMELVKKLSRMRHANRILTAGKTEWLTNDKEDAVISFARVCGKKKVVVLVNMKNEPVNVTCHLEENVLTEMLSSGASFEGGKELRATLKPFGYLVLKN